MARKTKIDALKTRQQLLDAAITEFASRGFSRTTLTDIARAAGVTRGAVYWHFQSKEALFNEIWKEQVPVRQLITPLLSCETQHNPLQLLRETLTLALQYISCNPRWRALMQILYQKCEFSSEMISEEEIRSQIGFNKERMAALIRQCIATGQVAESTDVELMIILFFGCLSGIVKNWLLKPDSINLYGQASAIVDNMLMILPRNNQDKLSAINPAGNNVPITFHKPAAPFHFDEQ
ncbi:acrEF/envCD operon transcriptional regulator [Franconibacter helveticus]|uniref:acrEF/envCD operon transcriptional regulator n=1 Tax=Franconibacter helveticus TaxID=357240 RepID=UPI00066D1CCA|nr:acrEF/envCD operon transcriptional regulator [Franconibacter helveticus]